MSVYREPTSPEAKMLCGAESLCSSCLEKGQLPGVARSGHVPYIKAMFAYLTVAAICSVNLHPGDTAPDFSAIDTAGEKQSLSAMVQKGPVILAFFPKAFTPGCTEELSGFGDRGADLAAQAVRVLAISGDDTATLARFKNDLHAPFTFIADPQARLMELYGVKMPFVKLAKRTTFVVGSERKITRIDTSSDAINLKDALRAVMSQAAGK